MKKNKSWPKGLFWAFVSLFLMYSMFGFSGQDASQSSSLSLQFAKILTPWLPIDTAQFLVRKLAHFTIYALMGFSYFRSLFYLTLKNKKECFLLSLVLLMAYASLDEFHQLFVAGRSGQIQDVMLDSCGGLLGSWISSLWFLN